MVNCHSEPRSGLNMEAELGCYSELDNLASGFNSWFSWHCLCDCLPHNCWKSTLQNTQVSLHMRGPHHLNVHCSGGCSRSVLHLWGRTAWDELLLPPLSSPTPIDRIWSLNERKNCHGTVCNKAVSVHPIVCLTSSLKREVLTIIMNKINGHRWWNPPTLWSCAYSVKLFMPMTIARTRY